MRARQPRRPTPRRILIGALFLLAVVYYFLLSGSSNDDELYHPADRAAMRAAARAGSSTPESPSNTTKNTESKILHSIIVPTYHERPNIRPLVTAVFGALSAELRTQTELVIVDDDSRDGTDEVVDALHEEEGAYEKGYINVVLVVRKKSEGTGLSSAVLRGFEEARGESLVIMDADLQHPPSSLPSFFTVLSDHTTPFVIGTRYAPGSKINANWPLYRRFMSWGARSLARPLTSASDPMSGFFGLRKELFLASPPLTPTGFKIGLELLLKAPVPRGGLKEVGYAFGVRSEGSSKLGAKVMLRYLFQLGALYRWRLGPLFPLILLTLITLFLLLGLLAALAVVVVLQRAGVRVHAVEVVLELVGLEGVVERLGGGPGITMGMGMGAREREREKDRERRRRVRGEV
ncbi:nucleotide-diphospho-sugar transferase [Mycena filopes]|nr:nucleotide-diphospho-sugar transferase [Mycena filopes]